MTTSPARVYANIKDNHGMVLNEKAVAGFCRRHHIQRLSIIRADAQNDQASARNFDMMVEFVPEHVPGRFALVAMEIELTQMAGRRIDLRTYEELSATTSSRILGDAKTVFQA